MPTAIYDSDYETAETILSPQIPVIRGMIALAIAQERERCAGLAERLSGKPGWSPGYKGAAEAIAKIIRDHPRS